VGDGRQEFGVFVEDQGKGSVLDDDGAVRNGFDDHLVTVFTLVGRAPHAEHLSGFTLESGFILRAK